MTSTYRLAVTGDVITNSRVSACGDAEVLAGVAVLRDADVTCAHLEKPLHDFDTDDVFPAAEGALSWMRGPSFIADELAWCGVDLVSTASNHSLDYSYGGMARTWDGLDRAGIAMPARLRPRGRPCPRLRRQRCGSDRARPRPRHSLRSPARARSARTPGAARASTRCATCTW